MEMCVNINHTGELYVSSEFICEGKTKIITVKTDKNTKTFLLQKDQQTPEKKSMQ